jgi:peptide/nickel transport system permease protein
VTELLRERLPSTLLVMVLATFLLFVVGIPLGLLAAAERGRLFDRVVQGVLFVLHAMPEFWVATICLIYLCSDAHWHVFPVGGLLTPESEEALRTGEAWIVSPRVLLDAAHHLVLPVLVLVFPALVVVARHIRAAALEALGARFVMAARARGIPRRRILFAHVLRSCAAPAIALFTSVLPGLVTGSILIEYLFTLEGMGYLTWQAASLHDFPVGMAILTLVAVTMLLAHVLTDVLHALVDPRVRLS